LRLTAGREIETRCVPREDAVEQLAPLPDLFPDWIRVGADPSGRIVAEQHELLRRLYRQRPQQQAVDDGEDGGVRADAERERKDGDDRHDRRRPQRTEGQADVVHAGYVRRPAPRLRWRAATLLLADECGVAEEPGCAHAGREPVVRELRADPPEPRAD